MDPLQALAVSVTPVVLISACGLITMALYTRLGVILARIRTFHQHKLEVLTKCDGREDGRQGVLLELLDSQLVKVTSKARLVQKGLCCLLASVAAFLVSALLGVAASLSPAVGVAALIAHVLGLVLFLAGVGWAARELTQSLRPLEEETAYLEVMAAPQGVRPVDQPPLRIADRA